MVRRVARNIPAVVAAAGIVFSCAAPQAEACPLKRLLSKNSSSSNHVSESTKNTSAPNKTAQLPKRTTSASEAEVVQGLPSLLRWQTSEKPKGVLLCLHELGMHAGRFEDLGTRMAAEGYSVYAMDLRGFGAWRGVGGKDASMSIDRSLEDTRLVLESIRKNNPGMPVFLLGEAMGGAMALSIAAQYPQLVQGVISSAPGGDHFKTVSNYLQVGGRVLTGRQNKDAEMAADLIGMGTPRETLQRSIKSDPWVRMDLTPKELMSCQFFMYKTRNFAKKIKEKPVMIVQGARDGESKPEGAEKISNDLATKDKEYLVVQEGDHYVYQDNRIDDSVMKSTLSFLDKHASVYESSLGIAK